MGRKIENFDDWYGGIAVGKHQAYEKYVKYVFRTKMDQYIKKLHEIHDKDLVERLFNHMLEETGDAELDISSMINSIDQALQDQIKLNRAANSLIASEE
ncbi:hypothetical protein [Litchfieldia alkalitelluris]|uniref:hypothetical protein n=1 Tax=Litchfieldia alkalitelluris TaxID=304268 RepID=UPI000998AC23|nr:hypothetical protein [Litchfieldia alkalitelluris]